MKKIIKTAAIAALALTLSAGAISLAACGTKTSYNGEYKYENTRVENEYYGIKVRVNVRSDGAGDRIDSVEVVDSVYVEASANRGNWDNAVWYNNVDDLLLTYRGKHISDVLAQTVEVGQDGAPTSVSGEEYVITGATVGSGRLLLAVQSALWDAAENLGYSFYYGEYKYENAWEPGQYYGIKVAVAVKEDKIMGVNVVPSEYVEASANRGTWDNSVWYNNVQNLLQAYRMRTVEEVKSLTVEVEQDGAPSGVSNEEYLITGATIGSGRLLLAVQNALKDYAPQPAE